MKSFIIVLAGIAGIILIAVISIAQRGVDTGVEMADQTVFNASKNVYSYEQFIAKKNTYDEYAQQQQQAQARLDELKAGGTTSGGEYDNIVMEINGARNMQHKIAAEYNSMSETSYQTIWKQKGLPDRLGDAPTSTK